MTMNIEEIKNTLKSNYEYCSKLYAILFVKSIDPSTSTKEIINAYNCVYA